MNTKYGKAPWLALAAVWMLMGAGIPSEASASDPVLVFSTYLGGSQQDRGEAIAVDEQGDVYVTGYTNSHNFPGSVTSPGAPPYPPYRPAGTPPYASDSYLTKMDSSGRILFTAFVGTERSDIARGIAVGPSSVAVTGLSLGPNGSSVYLSQLGRVNPFLSYSFQYLTGEEYWCQGFATVVDSSGNAYVTGIIPDRIHVAVSPEGEVYITGTTSSADFPVTPDAMDSTLAGTNDLFVAKLDRSGSLVYATYLGGNDDSEDTPRIALDQAGGIFLSGNGISDNSPFADPDQPECLRSFVARLDLRGSGSLRSFCLPGVRIWDMAADSKSNVYVTGDPVWADFPVVNAAQPNLGGEQDAFVAKIAFNRPPDCAAATASPSLLWPPNGKLVPVSVLGVTDPDGDPITLTITGIHQDEPITSSLGFDAAGLGASSATVRAERTGEGDGRMYRISFEASDDHSATCSGVIKLCVPHDSRPGVACGDGGALFDSTRK